MSVSGSMYTGIAGLRAHSLAMGVISDNIANVNTIGYKTQRANFTDVLGGAIAGDRTGVGSRIGSVQTVFSQGALLGTGNNMDLAIQGDGFFVLSDPSVSGGFFFTRAGQFVMDDSGFITNQGGLRVQGYGTTGNGELGATLGDILVPLTAIPPQETSIITVDANLDAAQNVNPTAFDINAPTSTSDFATNVTVYDSVGTPHHLELYFKKTQDAPSPQWEYYITVGSNEVDPAPPGDRAVLSTGTLDFDTNGLLTTNSNVSFNVQWAGADNTTVALDFGRPITDGGSGADGITSYAGLSSVSFIDQDGNSSGEIGGITIDDEGLIVGVYTNGQTQTLGQISMARFTSEDGLERVGEGMYVSTRQSGEPLIGTAGVGSYGSVISGTLESSNVDLASEFVAMITVQRGFQGNSRTITTADEMLAEIVSLKR